VQILFPHVPDEANSNLVQTVFKQVHILHICLPPHSQII